MTTHELAEKLKELPNVKVVVDGLEIVTLEPLVENSKLTIQKKETEVVKDGVKKLRTTYVATGVVVGVGLVLEEEEEVVGVTS